MLKLVGREFGVFVAGAVQKIEYELDGRQAIPKVGVLSSEGTLIRFLVEAEDQQSIRLDYEERRLLGSPGALYPALICRPSIEQARMIVIQ